MEKREPIVLENDGHKIIGVLHHPIGVEKAPYVLFCHGLAGHKIGKYRIYVKIAHQLAKQGIGSFRFDFRGSGDSEGDFRDVTIESKISDAEKAMEFLLNHSGVDHNRLGIYGRSLGAVIGIIAGSRAPGVKSLVLWSPFFNGQQWLHFWEAYRANMLTPEQKEELMRFNSQLAGEGLFEQLFDIELQKDLKALHGADMLIFTPEKDEVLDMSHTENYIQCRNEAEGVSEFVRLPLSDHDFSNPLERNLAIKRTVEWFTRSLLGKGKWKGNYFFRIYKKLTNLIGV